MKVNEFHSPLIAVNSDGFREVRPNQREGQRSLISSRVRLLLSNALGVKKFRYTAYRNMPKEVIKDGIFHICVEGLFEGQKKRERIDPEVLYIGMQVGVQFCLEYQKWYKNRFVDVVNGQLHSWEKYGNVERWGKNARTSMFRSGLKSVGDDLEDGRYYTPTFDLNAMDE